MIVSSTCLILLFISFAQCQLVPLTMENYGPILSDIGRFYKVTTVFFLHGKNSVRDLRILQIFHSWVRGLSKLGLVVGEVIFSELHTIKFYYRRIVRPIFIVLLTKDGFEEFSNATRTFDMAFPVWFVLFSNETGNSSKCHHPVGNPFNVVFNTEMAVLCSDDTVIREWYSSHENRTEIHDLAVWTKDKGLVFVAPRSLYDRRNDMYGATLRVVIVKDAPFVVYDVNSKQQLHGVFGIVLEELSKVLNFTIDIVKEVANYGNHVNGNWSGAMGELYLDNADIGVGDFSMTPLRLDVVDFTLPLIISKNCMYIRQTGTWLVQWLAYFEVLSVGIWIAVFVVIITSTIFVAFIQSYTCKDDVGYLERILQNCLPHWGFFCQQGLADFPKEVPLRITYFSLSLTGYVAYAAYSASLISFLTISIPSLPFSTMEGFVKDGSYKLAVNRGSAEYDYFANSKDPIASRMWSLMKTEDQLPRSVMEGFYQACHEKVAFYTSSEVKKILDPYIPCQLAKIDIGRIDNLALIMSKHNQFNDLINYQLQKFMDNGMLNRLKESFTSRKRPSERTNRPVCMRSIAPALVLLAIGFALCIFIFLLEKHYYRSNTKNSVVVPLKTKIPRRKKKYNKGEYRLYYLNHM